MTLSTTDKLNLAKDLATAEPARALNLCNEVLAEEPDFDTENSLFALFLIGFLFQEKDWHGLAYHIYARCGQMSPHQSKIWSNMGMCFDQRNFQKAVYIFNKALSCDERNASAHANLGLIDIQTGDPDGCIEKSERALKYDPSLIAPKHNMALAKLMKREWAEGWDLWYHTQGIKQRKPRDYGLPVWDGKSHGKVLIYGEQGCGDEIQYASIFREVQLTNPIVIDCDPRFVGLFRRSFNCPVYGDRFATSTKAVEDQQPDYQLASGQLPYYYRRKESDFPGMPYIVPDPDRVLQWGALLQKYRRHRGKIIGIATQGGSIDTGSLFRSVDIETFLPLIKPVNTLVNFDYGEVDQKTMDCLGIKYWPRAVKKGTDFDDTLALLSCCDLVVTPCTALAHFAGALGIECHVLVPPDNPPYQFHNSGSSTPWYNSLVLHRKPFNEAIKTLASEV